MYLFCPLTITLFVNPAIERLTLFLSAALMLTRLAIGLMLFCWFQYSVILPTLASAILRYCASDMAL